MARLELAVVYLEGRGISQLCYTCFLLFNISILLILLSLEGRIAALDTTWAATGAAQVANPSFIKNGPVRMG